MRNQNKAENVNWRSVSRKKGAMLVEENQESSLMNINKSKETSMNNVLPIEIDFLFKIYISSADRREDTGFHTR